MPLNPFSPLSGWSRSKGDVDVTPEKKYVIQRLQDKKYAGDDERPKDTLEEAQKFDSKPLAALWADRMQSKHPGNWEAIEHPGVDDPEDEDPTEAYSRSVGKRAA